MVFVANKSFPKSLQKIVYFKVKQLYWKKAATKLLHKTFITRLNTLKLLPNFTKIARANLALVQIPFYLNPLLITFLHLLVSFNNFINSFVDRTANLMDEIDEVAITYNDKVAKFRALHTRWAYKNIKKEVLVYEKALQKWLALFEPVIKSRQLYISQKNLKKKRIKLVIMKNIWATENRVFVALQKD